MLCSSPYIKHLVILILRNKLHPELIQIICNMYHELVSFTNFINMKTLESTKCTFKTEPIDSKNISIRKLIRPFFNITFDMSRPCQDLYKIITDMDDLLSKYHCKSCHETCCFMAFDYTKIIDKSGKCLIKDEPLDKYIEIIRKYKQIEILFEFTSIMTEPFHAQYTIKTLICS